MVVYVCNHKLLRDLGGNTIVTGLLRESNPEPTNAGSAYLPPHHACIVEALAENPDPKCMCQGVYFWNLNKKLIFSIIEAQNRRNSHFDTYLACVAMNSLFSAVCFLTTLWDNASVYGVALIFCVF